MFSKIISFLANKIIMILFTLLCLALLLLSVHNALVPIVRTAGVETETSISHVIKGNGIVMPLKQYRLYAPKYLMIEDKMVSTNEIVEEGSPILKLSSAVDAGAMNTDVSKYQEQIDQLLSMNKMAHFNSAELKGQLEISKLRAETLASEVQKFKELYDFGGISQAEYMAKVDALAELKKSMSNLEQSIQRSDMAAAEQVQLNNKKIENIKKDMVSQDQRNYISTDADGVYHANQKIYIQSIITNDIAEENDIILEYADASTYMVEVRIEKDGQGLADFNSRENQIEIENRPYSIQIEDVREFDTYYILNARLTDEGNVNLKIGQRAKFTSRKKEQAETVVKKSAIAVVDKMEVNGECYVYSLEPSNAILGDYYVVTPVRCMILNIGEEYVEVENIGSGGGFLGRNTTVIDNPYSAYTKGMKVRVQ